MWMTKQVGVRLRGPLAQYGREFEGLLRGQGYTKLSATEHIRLLAHLSRWLEEQGVEPADLSPERLEEYAESRRTAGYTARLRVDSLAPLLGFLRGKGVVPEAPPKVAVSEVDRLLWRYHNYLIDERGLVPKVVEHWDNVARFFVSCQQASRAWDPATLDAAAVLAFAASELPRRGVSAAKNLAAGLRSFLRFLHLEGITRAPLAQAVPSVASWSGSSLPRGITGSEFNRLLAGCDRRRSRGRRDYAILLLLGRLGLRAGEVANLELEHLDWRAGDIVVSGKGRRQERLPLPTDVGEAVAAYLRRGRPRSDCRRVFLRAQAPLAGLSPPGISWVVYDACDRGGVPRVSAHRLRHTAATQMLQLGATLPEVAQVLRHARPDMTARYAKVDHARLATLALPWPGAAR
jgi:integrase/recombinase XerD